MKILPLLLIFLILWHGIQPCTAPRVFPNHVLEQWPQREDRATLLLRIQITLARTHQ